MSERAPILLTPVEIRLTSDEFTAIAGWPYPDSFVGRLLADDIPLRVRFGGCQVWVYRDPQDRLVGFGTLEVSLACGKQTNGQPHPYIPLLAVNPTIKSLGFGTTIVRHLVTQAQSLVGPLGEPYESVYLDVYTSSEKAIGVYAACGFA